MGGRREKKGGGKKKKKREGGPRAPFPFTLDLVGGEGIGRDGKKKERKEGKKKVLADAMNSSSFFLA